MDGINVYKGLTYTQNTSNTIAIEDNSKIQTKDSKIINTTDNVEINQKNNNIINTKKAYDTFLETCKNYFDESGSKSPIGDMSLEFNNILIEMRDRGMSIPDFTLDGTNPENNNFLSFIDKMKDFTTSLLKNNQITNIPSDFFEFCDSFKENLIRNGCK